MTLASCVEVDGGSGGASGLVVSGSMLLLGGGGVPGLLAGRGHQGGHPGGGLAESGVVGEGLGLAHRGGRDE